jgi:hypothetical protein
MLHGEVQREGYGEFWGQNRNQASSYQIVLLLLYWVIIYSFSEKKKITS